MLCETKICFCTLKDWSRAILKKTKPELRWIALVKIISLNGQIKVRLKIAVHKGTWAILQRGMCKSIVSRCPKTNTRYSQLWFMVIVLTLEGWMQMHVTLFVVVNVYVVFCFWLPYLTSILSLFSKDNVRWSTGLNTRLPVSSWLKPWRRTRRTCR